MHQDNASFNSSFSDFFFRKPWIGGSGKPQAQMGMGLGSALNSRDC